MLDWMIAYEEKLLALPPDAPIPRAIDCVFEHGILGHIAPADNAEFEKRAHGGKIAFTRDDPVLYWRILAAAESALHAHRIHTSFYDVIVTWPVIVACSMTRIKPDKEYTHGSPGDPVVKGFLGVIQRAESALKNLGHAPHYIPWGSRGKFQGIDVVVERYTSDGCAALRALDFKGHQKLYFVTKCGTAELFALNPANFGECRQQ